ncbi:beta-galactosidase [Parabacteroides sp. OttesenSCG-928-G06]|nr:beta-galactosidase [Parabacteroides sp. OttesenSCG-928-G06]
MKTQLTLLLSLLLLLSCSRSGDQISLAGEWQFKLDPADAGVGEQWYTQSFESVIQLPGSLQEQGYGEDVSVDTKWTGDQNDKTWFTDQKYEKYRQKGNVKFPYWLNPDKHYVGVAWYQKEITVPTGWKGKNIELALERTHWETTLYVDGKEQGHLNGLSTPHRYDLAGLTPGKHTLTLRVDNRVNVPVGVNAHSVSDHTQSNWNGIVGELQLTAKPAVYIEDIQLYPNRKNGQVKADITLKGNGETGAGVLTLTMETKEGSKVGKPLSLTFDNKEGDINLSALLEAGKDIQEWSEHSPALYRLRSHLSFDGAKQEQLTQFGFRDFEKAGTRFHVNGKPVFLRGTLECCIFPLTGYPAMDPAYWAKIYKACQDFGLNHVRFHSWCPPEVAFNVADSMGIYLQVECAAWAHIGDGEYIDQWFYEEGDRILKEYGNHPSFCMMAYGNEPGGGNQVAYLSALVDYWHKKDNRRVYTSAAGWPYIENADYWNAPNPRIQGWGEGLRSIINGQAPRTDYDFRHIIRKNMPTVSHEIGQWCVYPNFEEIKKYTGVLKAKNFEIFRETLQENNMGDLADDFLFASGRLQTLCYKADIEAALRTPGFAGFQLLDLHDFPGQGTALVGVLDPFWETKGYVDGKEYNMFCNQTVPLIRFPKMVWSNRDRLILPVEMAHFGAEELKDASIVWTIITADKRFLGKGSFRKDIPLDNCVSVGEINFSLETIDEPTQMTVSVEVENTSYKNEWNIWVYPEKKAEVANAPYVTSSLDNNALARLEKGENVLFLPAKGSVLPEKGGNVAVGFSSIFWNTAWTRRQPPHTLGILCDPAHPALAAFPTERYSDFQWWDIVAFSDAMNLDEFPADFRPVVHLIDDWFTNRKLGILWEAKVGNGKLMVCTADLNKDLTDRPAAAQLKQSVLEYMASNKFSPKQALDVEVIKGLFK